MLRTADALPAADLAVQQINDDSDILPGYCIQQKAFSSKVMRDACRVYLCAVGVDVRSNVQEFGRLSPRAYLWMSMRAAGEGK